MTVIETIGADLRSLRKNRGLTLEHVAEAIGKSVGWMSQVERGISHPETGDLDALARLFDVPRSLFAQPAAAPGETGRIVRAHARRAIGERVPGLVEDLLSPDLTDAFEVIHSTFLPGASRDRATSRPTQELGVIVAGKLDIWLGDDRFTVAQGDSFRIREESFRWANPYTDPAIAVWVIAPPVY